MSSEPTAMSWNRSGRGNGRRLFVDPAAVFDAVQDVFGRKWHLRIVYRLLENGPTGFSGLKSEVSGISSKMLSESLTALEAEGLVDRELVSEQPVRVEYSLTEEGRALEPVVSEIIEWSEEYVEGAEQ